MHGIAAGDADELVLRTSHSTLQQHMDHLPAVQKHFAATCDA
jgi:hypothetical protein